MASAPPQTFLRRHGAKLVASALITAGIVYALKQGGLKFIPEGGNFDHVRWWTVPLYLAVIVAMSWFRAVRWRYLLRASADVPNRKLLAVSLIGFAAIVVMPFRIGELVRPYMIRSPGRIDGSGRTVGRITMSAATGTIVAERIVDGLFLSIVLAIALYTVPTVHPLPDRVVGLKLSVAHVREMGYAMFGVFLAAFIVIVVFYAARDFARKATLAVFGLISKKLGEKLASMAESLADGLRCFGNARDSFAFLGETAIYWFLNAFGMWLLAYGCGVVHAGGAPITFGEACALMGMLGISILVPGPPGMLGTFQLGGYAGMTMFFPTSVVVGEGAAYVFLLYIIQVAWTILAAVWFLVRDPGAWRALEEAEGILPRPDSALDPAEKLAPPDAAR